MVFEISFGYSEASVLCIVYMTDIDKPHAPTNNIYDVCFFSRYKMVRHERDEGNEVNEDRFLLLQTAKQTYTEDGLNTLPLTYKVYYLFLFCFERIETLQKLLSKRVFTNPSVFNRWFYYLSIADRLHNPTYLPYPNTLLSLTTQLYHPTLPLELRSEHNFWPLLLV